MKKTLSILMSFTIIIGSLAGFSNQIQALDSWSIDSDQDWQVVYAVNNQNDALQDQQTGSGSVSQDIVGDGSAPSTYMHLSDTELAFRIRVSNNNGGTGASDYEFKNFAFVGIDGDVNGSIDFFLGAYNPSGSNGRIGIYGSASGYANDGPSTTGISGKPIIAFEPVRGVNYAITDAGGSFNGDSDYFISFSFDMADIQSAFATKGINFTSSSPFTFITGTAAQDNSFNQDINGMDGDGWSSGQTWQSLGTYAPITSVDGTATFYQINFDKNTGDTEASPATKVISASGGTDYVGTLPSVLPNKRGMFFQEWNTAVDGTGQKITSTTQVTSDMTAYAIWSDQQTYTVTFQTDGGTWDGGGSQDITVATFDGSVGDNMPAPPTLIGDFFEGWQISGTSTWFSSATPVTSNITVIASWNSKETKTANFYSDNALLVTLYSNGQSNNFNGTIPVIKKTGYQLDGWDYDDGSSPLSRENDIVGAGNYYAVWSAASYTVSFDDNVSDGTVSNMPSSVNGAGKFGDFATIITPVRDGYKFVEWNKLGDAAGEPLYTSTLISESVTFYAIWEPIINVTFNANGGQMEALGGGLTTTQVIHKTGDHLDYDPQPAYQDNYTFLGWGTSANASSTIDLHNLSDQSLANLTEFFAVWSPIYHVTFHPNNGQFAQLSVDTTKVVGTAYGSLAYMPGAPTRTGYNFVAWNTATDGSGDGFNVNSNVSGNTTVYAQWTPVTYTISYTLDGGAVATANPTSYNIESTTITLNNPTRSGDTFDGWTLDGGDQTPSTTMTLSQGTTGNKAYTAHWTEGADPVVTYVTNGGSSVDPQTTTSLGAAPSTTRAAYNFDGWYTDSGLSNKISNYPYAVNGDITLYAGWTPIDYTISYTLDGGNVASANPTSYNIETADITLNNPTKDGFHFTGWTLDGGSTTPSTSLTIIQGSTGNKAFTANWSEVVLPVVTFVTNGGSSVSSQSTTSLTSAPTTSREGYTFDGWYTEEGLTNLISNYPYAVNADMTLYAGWTPISYSISYTLDGGSVATANPSSYNVESGDITLNNPTKDGYNFTGWTLDGGSTTPTTTMILSQGSTGNKAYTANWTQVQEVLPVVTFITNGGSALASISTNSIDTEPIITREGYNFLGWYTDSNLTTAISQYPFSVTEDITLYAKWEAVNNNYEIQGDVVDDTGDQNPMTNVEVMIKKGNTQYGPTVTTDAQGHFIIGNIPAGIYNLIMSVPGEDRTEIVTITISGPNHQINLGSVTFPLNDASSKLIVQGNDTPPVVVDNLHLEAIDYFDEEDALRNPLDNLFVKVEMTVEKTDETEEDPEVLTGVTSLKSKAETEDYTIGLYLDMNINKYIRNDEAADWNDDGKITETGSLIRIIVPIPENIQGKDDYKIYRYHDNTVHVISTVANAYGEYLVINEDDWTLDLYVKLFSVYAIGYVGPVAAVVAAPSPYLVKFDGNGGEPANNYEFVYKYGHIVPLEEPVLEGYTFSGWLASDGSLWDFANDRVTSNVVLTASWTEIPKVTGSHIAYMQGYPDGTFRPDGYMTRAEAAVMFTRLLTNQMNLSVSYTQSYKDVDSNAWYSDYVGYLTSIGMVNGYPDGSFQPDNYVTKAEFSAIAAKFVDSYDHNYNAAIIFEKATWARSAIEILAAQGLIDSLLNGSVDFDEPITRLEIVGIVNQMLGRSYDATYGADNSASVKEYADVPKNMKAYGDIMEASQIHEFELNEASELWLRVK